MTGWFHDGLLKGIDTPIIHRHDAIDNHIPPPADDLGQRQYRGRGWGDGRTDARFVHFNRIDGDIRCRFERHESFRLEADNPDFMAFLSHRQPASSTKRPSLREHQVSRDVTGHGSKEHSGL